MAKVCVLMPAFNTQPYIKEAVESVLKQSYKDFIFVIVDDCSTDGTYEELVTLAKKDKRIKLHRNEHNSGRPYTRNKLLSLVPNSCEYMMWMDSDDVITKDLLEKKVSYMEHHREVDLLGSAIDYVKEDLSFIKRKVFLTYHDDIKKQAMISSPMSQGGIMMRKTVADERYSDDFKVCQDYEMWMRLLDSGYVFHNLRESFYLYRQFPNQGKQKNLKLTLWNTLRIKTRYIFKPKNWSFHAFGRYGVELGLFILPKKVVLWLFYKTK